MTGLNAKNIRTQPKGTVTWTVYAQKMKDSISIFTWQEVTGNGNLSALCSWMQKRRCTLELIQAPLCSYLRHGVYQADGEQGEDTGCSSCLRSWCWPCMTHLSQFLPLWKVHGWWMNAMMPFLVMMAVNWKSLLTLKYHKGTPQAYFSSGIFKQQLYLSNLVCLSSPILASS